MHQESEIAEWDEHEKVLLATAAEIRSHKRNVDEDISRISESKMRFFLQSQKYSFDGKCTAGKEPSASNVSSSELDIFESISVAVDTIRPSYAAPAMHLNSYLECQAVDIEWDVTKHMLPIDAERMSMGLRSVSIEVYWSAVMLAIKGALDRLVRALHFFYPGIAAHTTWGRYDAKGKASGFMAVVQRGKDSDELLAYFDKAYTDWIAAAVAPRDALTHYQDPYSSWHLHPDGHSLASTQHIEDSSNHLHTLKTETLMDLVQRWYDLADHTFAGLASRQPRLPKKPSE